jgi:hypothetical protein
MTSRPPSPSTGSDARSWPSWSCWRQLNNRHRAGRAP